MVAWASYRVYIVCISAQGGVHHLIVASRHQPITWTNVESVRFCDIHHLRASAQAAILYAFLNYICKTTATSLRGQWVKYQDAQLYNLSL